MKFLTSADGGTVILSRRNLLALLHKLDMEGSHLTLIKDNPQGQRLTLMAEEDDVHYQGRTPGKMHPETEKFIAERKVLK